MLCFILRQSILKHMPKCESEGVADSVEELMHVEARMRSTRSAIEKLKSECDEGT